MDRTMQSGQFRAALRIVRASLLERINQTAQISLANDILCVAIGLRPASLVDQLFLQRSDIDRIQSLFHHSARFNMLDLLSIGQDHIFIINRDMLLQDIHDLLAEPPRGIQRVFVNIDRRLPTPEIMPSNRCRVLEGYVREFLLPEIEHRVENWREGEHCYNPLPFPEKASLVTLTGWLLNYPVLYVIPKRAAAAAQPPRAPSAARRKRHLMEQPPDANGAIKDGDKDEKDNMDKVGEYEGEGEGEDVDNDEDDEEDCGRNCLANQLLVVTKVQLEPSDDIDDLTDHCLLSFSYPADLAEQCIDRTNPTPESPVASTPDYDDEDEDEDQEFVDASDVEYCESDQECNAAFLATLAMTTEDIHVYDDFVPECKPVAMMANNLDPSASYLKPQPQANGELRIKTSTPYDRLQDDITPTNASSPSIQRRQEDLPLHHLSGSDCYNKKGRPLPPPVPPRNPDLHAAGRSFLHQLHTRFQKQTVWKAWEVGQQKVILPVVAM